MKTIVLLVGVSLFGIIEGCKNGKNEFKPFPNDCNKYYAVVDGKKHELSCTNGLYFNEANCMCDYPENVKGCKMIKCEKDKLYYVASEGSCTEYFMCYKGKPVKQQCADGMEFDPDSSKCIRAKDSKCFINTCPQDDDNKDLVFIPSKNCQEYFICVKGKPVKQNCAKGMHWSRKRDRCEKEEEAGCEKKKPQPEPEPEED